MANKFRALIVWGAYPERENCKIPYEYKFKTEAELEAFLLGVNESDGWLEAAVFENEEEHAEWYREEYGENPDGSAIEAYETKCPMCHSKNVTLVRNEYQYSMGDLEMPEYICRECLSNLREEI